MMLTTPVPAAAAAVPAATPVPKLPAGGAPAAAAPPVADDAPPPGAAGQATDGARAPAPAPGGASAPADAAAAKQAIIEKLEKTTAADAIEQVGSHLDELATLSVGGGSPEGTEGAKVASALLTDASMLLQHAHVKAMEQLRTMATELHIRLMSSASGLAYMGGQVAIAGQSKEPVRLAEIAAGPIRETKATMADVIGAILPKDAAPAPAGAPKGLQHVTPGPGAGRGPNPA